MISSKHNLTNSTPEHATQHTAETLSRYAQLIADGRADWPEGLSTQQENRLLREVRRLRRLRLVRLVASSIARDIGRK